MNAALIFLGKDLSPIPPLGPKRLFWTSKPANNASSRANELSNPPNKSEMYSTHFSPKFKLFFHQLPSTFVTATSFRRWCPLNQFYF